MEMYTHVGKMGKVIDQISSTFTLHLYAEYMYVCKLLMP